MIPWSILVIDDEASWLRLMRRVLADCGCEMHTALTCADGIRLAAQLKPDCILLDFHLTDGNAVSVCAALNASEITRGIPVIVISGDPEAKTAAYAECRAALFLEKGTRCVQTIPAAIERILQGKRCAARLQPLSKGTQGQNMGQKARTMIPLLCAVFLFSALCPPARAEAREAKPGSPEAQEASPGRKTEKPKKKRKKAKPVKAVSEYKFITADPTPSYHFDKKGDPILKRGKYATGAKGGGEKSLPKSSKAAGQSAIPKLNAAAKPGAARYVCPMGDYEGDKPGQCPKCGMTLVEKK